MKNFACPVIGKYPALREMLSPALAGTPCAIASKESKPALRYVFKDVFMCFALS